VDFQGADAGEVAFREQFITTALRVERQIVEPHTMFQQPFDKAAPVRKPESADSFVEGEKVRHYRDLNLRGAQ
jgi:hypothetical protein